MKTYTFKIKVDTDKIVVACHMQFEQFYDSVKMSHMEDLLNRYPHSFITASDYHVDEDYIEKDYCLSTLKCLFDSKNIKSYLTSADYYGFVGDEDFNPVCSAQAVDKAHDYILSTENIDEECDKNV